MKLNQSIKMKAGDGSGKLEDVTYDHSFMLGVVSEDGVTLTLKNNQN